VCSIYGIRTAALQTGRYNTHLALDPCEVILNMIKKLNIICYTICIICIVISVVLCLMLIWGDFEREVIWKSFLTLTVFFLASALTLSVNKMISSPTATPDKT
jgi:hypothetical protein